MKQTKTRPECPAEKHKQLMSLQDFLLIKSKEILVLLAFNKSPLHEELLASQSKLLRHFMMIGFWFVLKTHSLLVVVDAVTNDSLV